MGWWSSLFGRRGAPAPPSRALPAPAPAAEAPAEPAPAPPPEVAPEAAPAPAPDVLSEPEEGREISSARLDAALDRLRETHPPKPEN